MIENELEIFFKKWNYLISKGQSVEFQKFSKATSKQYPNLFVHNFMGNKFNSKTNILIYGLTFNTEAVCKEPSNWYLWISILRNYK